MPHFQYGDVSADVDGVTARVRGMHGRTFPHRHRKKEDLVGTAVLCLVENLHKVEELLGGYRG